MPAEEETSQLVLGRPGHRHNRAEAMPSLTSQHACQKAHLQGGLAVLDEYTIAHTLIFLLPQTR